MTDDTQIALSVIERSILTALSHVREPGWCLNLHCVSARTGLPREVCRGVMRELVDAGMAEYHRGLWTDDGEPGGAGYCITDLGSMMVMPERW